MTSSTAAGGADILTATFDKSFAIDSTLAITNVPTVNLALHGASSLDALGIIGGSSGPSTITVTGSGAFTVTDLRVNLDGLGDDRPTVGNRARDRTGHHDRGWPSRQSAGRRRLRNGRRAELRQGRGADRPDLPDGDRLAWRIHRHDIGLRRCGRLGLQRQHQRSAGRWRAQHHGRGRRRQQHPDRRRVGQRRVELRPRAPRA
ncbi:MAG: hypothetical protein WDO24_12160 [Pseudomonadota bacterium]